ncbi:MAG: amidase [Advenella sp.]|uniref:amidase n=1 Tax=Advenella sp. TaxID=1872388 RepID=UPI003F9C1B8C
MRESIKELLDAYGSGMRSPMEVVTATLKARAAAHAQFNCTVLALDEQASERAYESAKRWRNGRPRALEGVPFSIKDIMHFAGTPTSAGSLVADPRPVPTTAEVVGRLLDAGAIPIAKDTTTEWAIGGAYNLRFGVTRNPLSTDRWAGGSSCGSAAMVSAGVVPFAVGTDTGGSTRVPAAFCGVTGFKPSNSSISREGVVPLSPTLDTVGLLCSNAADAQKVFHVLAPTMRNESDTLTTHVAIRANRLDGVRIGVTRSHFLKGVDAIVGEAFQAFLYSLRDLGAKIVEIELKLAPLAQEIGYQLLYTEAWAIHNAQRPNFQDYDSVARNRITRGAVSSAEDYLGMLSFRAALVREFQTCFGVVDLIATPGCPGTAATLDTMTIAINGQDVPLLDAQSRATMMCNVAELPAIMLPIGRAKDGLPVAVQLAAGPLQDNHCLRVALAYQSVTSHHHR